MKSETKNGCVVFKYCKTNHDDSGPGAVCSVNAFQFHSYFFFFELMFIGNSSMNIIYNKNELSCRKTWMKCIYCMCEEKKMRKGCKCEIDQMHGWWSASTAQNSCYHLHNLWTFTVNRWIVFLCVVFLLYLYQSFVSLHC